MEEYLTTSEAAALARVGVSSIKRWVDEQRITSSRTPGGHRRIARSELLRFMSNSNAQSDPTATGIAGSAWADVLLSQDRHMVQARLFESRSMLGSWTDVMNELGTGVTAVGQRWSDGTISVGDEHVASEVLARVLVSIHDTLPVSQTAPLCLLATAVGDIHTLGLSMLQVVLREAGWRSAWIGARTPTSVLCEMISRSKGAMVAISASQMSSDEKALSLQVRQVAAACRAKGATLVLGGSGAWPKQPIGASRFDDFLSFYDFAVAKA